MSNELTAERSKETTTRLKWIGFILMASGVLSFSENTFAGDIVALSGVVLFLGACIWSRFKK